MKKLDLYILKKFLGTFFFMITVIMAIAIVFDVSEKLEKFLANEVPLKAVIFDYYLNFVLYYGNLFSSLLIFLSVLLFTSQMAQRTEIVAILSGGISFRRMLFPYFLGATLLTGIALYFTHVQLPYANKQRLAFEEQYFRSAFRISEKDLHRQISPGTLAYFHSFNAESSTGYKFSLEQWKEGRLQSKLFADRARYDSTSNRWIIEDYYTRTFTSEGEKIDVGKKLDTALNMKPIDFGQRLSFAAAMNYSELNSFIKAQKMIGSDTAVFYEIEKHQRTSYPMATYILTLIGVSLASRKVRGGIGIHLAVGVLLVLIYIFAMKVTTVAATNAGLDPLLAVWLPNILFFFVSIYLYFKAQK